MNKKFLAVIFGGVSTEHEVSLISASFVIENVNYNKYEVIKIGISKLGEWYLYNGDVDNIKNGTWIDDKSNKSVFFSMDRSKKGIYIKDNSTIEFQNIDIVFPVLHGRNGEDGSIQGLLSIAGIPFVGCGIASSAVCMDKQLTHIVLDASGIKTSPWLCLNKLDFLNVDFNILEKEYKNKLSYPMFVKPANAGSSVGVKKVENKEELYEAIQVGLKIDNKVVIEKAINAREIECAVIGNEDIYASALGEIVYSKEFYDYEAKYNDESSILHIPAEIKDEIANEVRKIAKRAYKVLGCNGMARMDFFINEKDEIILNEPNTIPGFTSISMYPKLLMFSGYEKKSIIDKLIELAEEDYNNKVKYDNINGVLLNG